MATPAPAYYAPEDADAGEWWWPEEPPPYSRVIVLAVDGSTSSDIAFDWALAHFLQPEDRVFVVCVTLLLPEDGVSLQADLASCRTVALAHRAKLRERGVNAVRCVVDSCISQTQLLAGVANTEGADYLVMGRTRNVLLRGLGMTKYKDVLRKCKKSKVLEIGQRDETPVGVDI
ncbi:hypothetical protein HK405_015231 [Cladochytrium tenue]|nr:hypothetical protein HK405_015231 [Cladochytrium tenue]